MFEKKKCEACGEKVNDNWSYCPNCGRSINSKILDKNVAAMQKNFEKMFKGSFFKILSSANKPVQRPRGVSIHISSGLGTQPRIEIRTPEQHKKTDSEIEKFSEFVEKPAVKQRKTPKVTVEPKIEIKNEGLKRVAIVKLDDVKSVEDVEIKRLEQSVEIKAYSDDRAYFALIPLAQSEEVTNENFDKGILTLELQKYK